MTGNIYLKTTLKGKKFNKTKKLEPYNASLAQIFILQKWVLHSSSNEKILK